MTVDGLNRLSNQECPSIEQWSAILQLGPDDSYSLQFREHLNSCPGCRQALDQLTSASGLTAFKFALKFAGQAGSDANVDQLKLRLRELIYSTPNPLAQNGDRTTDPRQRDTPIFGVQPSSTIYPADKQPCVSPIEDNSDQRTVEQPPFREHNQEAPLHRLGRYDILSLLGRGGMGTVYLGYDSQVNRKVALKTFDTSRPDLEQRLRREAQAIAQLDSPFVVRLLGLETTTEAQPFLVMEYVDGETMAERISRTGKLSSKESARLCQLAANGVAEAHEKGILHRDIKPSNILIDATDCPKVADFGLAAFVELSSRLTHGDQTLGTPAYMSPEQAMRQNSTAASDVYCLGCVLYEMLTGVCFHQGTPIEILQQLSSTTPFPIQLSKLGLPQDLVTICEKALAPDPQARYATAGDLAADLARFRSGDPILARPTSLFRKLGFRFRRNRTRFLVAGVVGSILLAVASWGLISNLESRRQSRRSKEIEREAEVNRQNLETQRDQALQQLQDTALETHDMLTSRAGTLELRKSIIESALEQLEQVCGDETNPRLDRNSALAYLRLGQIQLALGDVEQGKVSLDRAQDLAEQLNVKSLDDENSCLDLAAILFSQGESELSLRNLVAAEKFYLQALELRQFAFQLRDQDNESEDMKQSSSHERPFQLKPYQQIVHNLVRLGDVSKATEGPAKAMDYFRQAHAWSLRLTETEPENSKYKQALLISLNRLAALALEDNRLDEALDHSKRWAELVTTLLSVDPGNVDYQCDSALALSQLARIHAAQDNFATAVEFAAQGVQKYRQVSENDPTNSTAKSWFATAMHMQGEIFFYNCQLSEAKQAFTSAAEIHSSLFKANPSNTRFAILGGESLLRAGICDLSDIEFEHGLKLFHQGYELMRQGAPAPEQNPVFSQQLNRLEKMVAIFDAAYELSQRDLDELDEADPAAMAISAYFSAKSSLIDRALIIARSLENFSDENADTMVNVHSMRAAVFAEVLEQISLSEVPNAKYPGLTRDQLLQPAILALKKSLHANPNWLQVMRRSPDYRILRNTPEFRELLLPQPSNAQ